MARIKAIPARPEIKRTAVYCLEWAWTAGWETGHLTYLYMTEKMQLIRAAFSLSVNSCGEGRILVSEREMR
ncbi:hypothetical protein [Allisonella histaminiformans]|uniref:hypothetical protein n=1 Tax=Allisonella histaminiformans TaxID=209880 RepID=UPI002E7A2F6C|nr:hypothetical protein [Allisonella histaminiformans]